MGDSVKRDFISETVTSKSIDFIGIQESMNKIAQTVFYKPCVVIYISIGSGHLLEEDQEG